MLSYYYKNIAPYYQHVFPFNPEHVEFLRHVLPYNGARVLDIGCATGELAIALTHFGFPVWGIDPDVQMTQMAQKNKPEDNMFPVFEQMVPTDIADRYPESYFDTVICFGDRLLHFIDRESVAGFIGSLFKVLSPEGRLALQLLNSEYIAENEGEMFPVIDNEHVRFERRGTIADEFGQIDIDARMTLKATGQVIEMPAKLFAIHANELREQLVKAGFVSVEFFGGFNREPFQAGSRLLVVSCMKP